MLTEIKENILYIIKMNKSYIDIQNNNNKNDKTTKLLNI